MHDSEDDRDDGDLGEGEILIEVDGFEQEEDDNDDEDRSISQVLKDIHENQRIQKRVDHTDKISPSDRRLDALAKIIEVYSGSTCIAVCIIDQVVTIASNDLCSKSHGVGRTAVTAAEERINELFAYFQNIAKTGVVPEYKTRRGFFENICKKAKYQSTNTPFYDVLEEADREKLIDAIMQSREPSSQALLKSMEQNAEFIAAKGNWLVLYRAFRKLERDLSEKKRNSAYGKISDEYFAVFQEKHVVLKDEKKIGVHAEAQLIANLLRRTQAVNAVGNKEYYIGIGKLCCLHCRTMVDVANTKIKSQPNLDELSIAVRGRHDISFGEKWVMPTFFGDKFLQAIITETKKVVAEVLSDAQRKHYSVMNPNLSQSPHTTSPFSLPGQVDSSTESLSVVQILKNSVSDGYRLLLEDEKNLMPLLVHLLNNPEFVDLFEETIALDSLPLESFKGLLKKAEEAAIFAESLEEDFLKILRSSNLIGARMVESFKTVSDTLEEEIKSKRKTEQSAKRQKAPG